ncbi:MAG: glutamate--cysteine ligase [Neisseriaceae bacterium]
MLKTPKQTTALHTTELDLEKDFSLHHHKIEHWFREQWMINKSPFYGSVDLRNSSYKLTPIDMNLYPGGFNNIHNESILLASQAINHLLEKYNPHTTKILLIPESHTRNYAYLKNVYTLNFILNQAGLETVIGSLSPEIKEPTNINISDGFSMIYHPIKRIGNKITTVSGFEPNLILVNNDLSSGKPDILDNLEQTLLPPLNTGWYMRKKTNFFTEYDKVCANFANLIEIDPWKINAYFDIASNLDFANSSGLDPLGEKVEHILQKIQKKYDEYNIKDTPFVIVKANSGTYGMGIMSIKSADEVRKINRKTRNKMAVIKEGQSVTDVIIQEGVYTVENINDMTAEPVIYMMGCSVIGGFYRANARKGIDENLNSIGSNFIPMSLACTCFPHSKKQEKLPDRFYAYSVTARLALLASSMEIKNY